MQHSRSRRNLCLTTLDSLVTELLKTQPDEKRVKECMTKVGLNYSADPISRMNAVLEVIDTSEPERHRRTNEKNL